MSKKVLKITSISLGSILAIIALGLLYLFLHNTYVVIPGEVYRSRELSQTKFEEVIKKYHIKTIINLRGRHPNRPWYQHEMAAVKDADIKHYNIALMSQTLPDIPTLKRLVHLIDDAPKPVLMHCESGVDRTGLASVLALILNNDHSIQQINRQVSIRYFVLHKRSVGKQFLKLYEAWLQQQHLQTSRHNFFVWLDQLKPGPDYPVFQDKNPAERPPLCST